jgi:hypothetical protein
MEAVIGSLDWEEGLGNSEVIDPGDVSNSS